MSALSNYIKGNNFNAKRKFISENNGLEFLTALICDAHNNKSLRLLKKGLILMYDLVLNDDNIFADAQPFYVWQFFCSCEPMLNTLINILSSNDLENFQKIDLRAYALKSLARLYQVKPAALGSLILQPLSEHKHRAKQLMEQENGSDLAQLLLNELVLVAMVEEAPNQPYEKNFVQDEKEAKKEFVSLKLGKWSLPLPPSLYNSINVSKHVYNIKYNLLRNNIIWV